MLSPISHVSARFRRLLLVCVWGVQRASAMLADGAVVPIRPRLVSSVVLCSA
jgi:hypothetical protein